MKVLPAVIAALLAACSSCGKHDPYEPGHTAGLNPACDTDPSSGWHVAVDGSPDGDGTLDDPWDLWTGLYDPPGVRAGDTIFLHGGVYTGSYVVKQDGEEGAPVTVRSYPGEWATIDGRGSDEVTLQIYWQWTVLRDLEITNSDPDRWTGRRPSGIYVEGEHISVVDILVHDVGTGIICNSASAEYEELAPELTVYGCLFYNNGWDDSDRAHGHHFYTQNRDGTKHLEENILFNAFGFGFHLYTDNDTHYNEGYDLIGNIAFQNGAGSAAHDKLYDNYLVGGRQPVRRLTMVGNLGWAAGPGERDVRLGWDVPGNEDATLRDNYVVGETIFQEDWAAVVLEGNTFYGNLTGVDPADHPDNTYLTDRPSESAAFVRPSSWQEGRGHVVVFNWALQDEVSVDLSPILAAGTAYQVRNAQDPLSDPVLSGTWDGSPVSLPMTGLEPIQPIGEPSAITPDQMTGPEFNVFLVIGNPCGR